MSMKRFKISTVLGLALASIAVSHAEPCALAKLGWIAGAWKNTADPHGAQERSGGPGRIGKNR
jgi:hypothetical protein